MHPNLVVVGYFINDTSDDFVFDKERLYNFLKSIPDSVMLYPLSEFLKNHSYLYLFLLTKYYTFTDGFKYNKPVTGTDWIRGWQLNGQSIRSMKEVSEAAGARFLLLVIPNIDRTYALE